MLYHRSHIKCFSMTTNSDFHLDSPISYTVEEGEISSGPTSPTDTVVDITQTMDTGVQTTLPQPQSPASSRPQTLIVHIDNPADKPVKYLSLSDKRKNIAAKAKEQRQITNQEVQFHPNYKPVANLVFQSNQLQATLLYQSTSLTNSQNLIQSTLQQHYYTNPYISNGNPYTNPPMPVFPPPIVINPPISEQLTEPPKNFNETTPRHQRIGTKPINPIVEHFNQVKRGENSMTRPNNLRFPETPRSNNPKSFSNKVHTNNQQATRLVTRFGLKTTT